MEEIMEIVSEYNALCKEYDYISGLFETLPADWADQHPDTIRKMVDNARWMASVAQKFADKLEELEYQLQAPCGYNEQEVYTIGQYIMQGYTADEAVQVRTHDIIWNKWVNGTATANEIVQMCNIRNMLGL